ncbi:FAD/NAD(P)-binding domain-containing protein, partial [Ophiobolus disseminans]
MMRNLVLSLVLANAPSALTSVCPANLPQVIDTDVAIIGGGAGGTYAAVRLREDLNTSIVVIEPRDHLGGHTSTYFVSEANTTLEYGVQSYLNYGPAVDFFKRFGLATQPFAPGRRLTAVNVDVESGALLTGYSAPNANATTEAFARWLSIVSQYEAITEPGYWDFPQPTNIPQDLLLPIEEFVKINQLEAAIPRILTISGLGYGGIRHLLTFNLVRAFGASLTKQVAANALVVPVGSNSLVYQRALTLLKDDVLLSSSVQSAKRTVNGVKLVVKQGKKEIHINAKRILFTAPPSLSVFEPYGIDEKEKAVFSQGSIEGEFIGVAKIPCIPENSSVSYLPSAIVPQNQLYLKDWPYSLRLDSTGPLGQGLFRVVLGANFTFSADGFKDLVVTAVQRLQAAGTVSGNCTVELKALSEHTRPHWYLSAEQLKAGFIADLFSLQGHLSTWYTGYAWSAPYSSTVWAFTDTVLPKLLADLRN